MAVRRTLFAGLTALDPGEPISTDNASFQNLNPEILDRLVEIGAVTHRHDAHSPLADPSASAAVTSQPQGGALPADLDLWVAYTLVDADGGETLPSPATLITTDPPIEPASGAISAVADYTAGSLLTDTYYYAKTLTDTGGGETPIGPIVSVEREPGFASGRVLLDGLSSGLGFPGVTAWRLYRAVGGGQLEFLATGTADEYIDDGSAHPECAVTPPLPSINTTNGASKLTVVIPTNALMASATSFRLYCALDDTFTTPCYVDLYPVASAGTPIEIVDLDFQAGEPPGVSRSIPGASKIDPDTDLLDWHWLRPVADQASLPSGAASGDVRITLDNGGLYAYIGGAWQSAGGGGSAHIIEDESTALPTRARLDFRGTGVSVSDEATRTVVTIPGGGGAGGGDYLTPDRATWANASGDVGEVWVEDTLYDDFSTDRLREYVFRDGSSPSRLALGSGYVSLSPANSFAVFGPPATTDDEVAATVKVTKNQEWIGRAGFKFSTADRTISGRIGSWGGFPFSGLVIYDDSTLTELANVQWLDATDGTTPPQHLWVRFIRRATELVLQGWNQKPWGSTFAYAAGRVVLYNGIGYMALASTTNQRPDLTPSKWMPMGNSDPGTLGAAPDRSLSFPLTGANASFGTAPVEAALILDSETSAADAVRFDDLKIVGPKRLRVAVADQVRTLLHEGGVSDFLPAVVNSDGATVSRVEEIAFDLTGPSGTNLAVYESSPRKMRVEMTVPISVWIMAGEDYLPRREDISFVGSGVVVTDDEVNARTVVTIPGGGGSGTSTWRGAWSGVTAYAADDAVSRNGSSYIALAATTNEAPESTPAKWGLLAQKGDPGAPGAPGADGSGGHTIREEGAALTQRASLDFVGGGVTVTDDAGAAKTVVTVPAPPPQLSRSTVQVTTASLASDVSEALDVALGKGFGLFAVQTDRAARVQLYATAAKRTADASRAIGTDPTGNHGIILDLVTTSGELLWILAPMVVGADMEAVPDANIAARITNKSGAASTVTATFTRVVTDF